jgi:solute:Na+ symporter, SSS family
MKLQWLDWGIVLGLLVVITIAANKTKKYTSTVADFLAANRCAGRYLLAVSDTMAGVGAISVVAMFEAYYRAGFTFVWWGILGSVVLIVISLSGWVQYRFRETRALTMAQFLETRYSKNLRIAAGLTAFVSGTLNFGLFPAVGARFFIYFCDLPRYSVLLFGVFPVDVTLAVVMAVLLAISLYFTFVGGQIAVMVTDFIQGVFFNAAFTIIVVVALVKFPWSQILETLSVRPVQDSLLDPFDTASTATFNKWYYLIAAFSSFWCFMAWLGNQGYSSAATNPHEARMGRALGGWRTYTQNMLFVILAVCAYTLMHHGDWAPQAAAVNHTLGTISADPENVLRQQAVTVLCLRYFLPLGLLGAFGGIMLAAFIGNHDTYLHSWGSIFVQDVILPFRKERLSTAGHLRLLRWSIFGVALFIFLFSLFFPQTGAILLFFSLTGTLFLGGAGTIIVLGLYWKRGTTAAAWAALAMGWVLFAFGIYVELIWPKSHSGAAFPLNAQWRFFLAMLVSIVAYVAISLLGRKQVFNLDKMLHRGEYARADDATIVTDRKVRGWQAALGINRDFTRLDKVVYLIVSYWSFLWGIIFCAVLLYRSAFSISAQAWAGFWHFYVWMAIVLCTVTTVWLSIGGLMDLKKMFHRLRTMVRDHRDDGEIVAEDNPQTAAPQACSKWGQTKTTV